MGLQAYTALSVMPLQGLSSIVVLCCTGPWAQAAQAADCKSELRFNSETILLNVCMACSPTSLLKS